MPARKPVLIPYTRKSSGEDDRLSRDRQRRSVERYATEHGIDLAPPVHEPGVSGSKSWRERGLGEALAACERGDADGIIVEEQSRLSRENGLATAEVWSAFEKARLRLVCVAEGLDTANGDQELSYAIRAALAREQWKQYARRIRHVKERAIARGAHIAGRVPVGYVRHARGANLQVDERFAPAVRAAFALRATGATITAVARMLDAEYPGGFDGRGTWTPQSVARMLQNRAYLGEARHGDLVNPDAHPALVDVQTFDVVQALVSRRDPREVGTAQSVLAGMLFCGTCGHALDRVKLNGNHASAGKYQYRCRRPHAGGKCPAPCSAMADDLDAYVLGLVRERVAGWSVASQDTTVDVDALHARIAAARAKRANFENPDYVAALGVDAALRGLAVVDEELAALDRELVDAVGTTSPSGIDVADALDHFENLPADAKRRTLAAEVASVTVNRASGRGRWQPLGERVVVRFAGENDLGVAA